MRSHLGHLTGESPTRLESLWRKLMTKVTLLGATGLVGDKVLRELVANSAVSQITTITRRDLDVKDAKINSIVEKDTSKWFNADYYKESDVAISAFGTTKANAGSIEKFKEIDYGNNLSFAEAAKKNGVKKFILVSSGGANPLSFFPYLKIKGELESEITKLDFDSLLILRPGLLVGERKESRPLEKLAQKTLQLPIINKLMGSNKVEVIASKIASLLGDSSKSKILLGAEINQ